MPAISFTVTRTGDLSKDGSVTYTLETDLVNADFVAGQSKTGTVSWAANETAAKTITYNTVGNTTDNDNRYLRLRLSNAVNGTIGTDAATTTILDDDTSATTDYIPDLAYGGIFLGAAIVDGGPGNTVCRRSDRDGGGIDAVVMYLEHMDPIVAIQCENRLDHYPLGTTEGGYSDKTVVNSGSGNRIADGNDEDPGIVVARARGGDLRWRVAKIISPAEGVAGRIVLEKVGTTSTIRWAGQTDTIVACGRDASWKTEWVRSGGGATASVDPSFSGTDRLGGFPTIWFTDGNGTLKPIDPVAMGWSIGDRIAFCLENLNADDLGTGSTRPDTATGKKVMQKPYASPSWHFMSLNHNHRNQRPLRKSTYKYLAYSGIDWDTQSLDATHGYRYAPHLLIGYRGADNVMHVKGNGYLGSASSMNIAFTRMRQIIYIPDDARWTGRRLRGFDAGVWRNSSSIGGNVTLRLQRATAGSVGASSDEGTLIGSRVIAAADIYIGGGRAGDADAVPQTAVTMNDTNFVANAVTTVKAGEAYYLDMAASVSGYTVGYMLNIVGRGVVGLLKADHVDVRNNIQTKSGSTWSDRAGQTNVIGNYTMIGVGLHLRA